MTQTESKVLLQQIRERLISRGIRVDLSGAKHFHSSDERFCGTTEQMRRFVLDPNEVTCEACNAKDTFVLSAQGEAFLRELEQSHAD